MIYLQRQEKDTNMNRIATTLAVTGAVLALGASPAHADVDPSITALDDCLAAHPGSVTYTEVTDGDDLVCSNGYRTPSLGDDTYMLTWVAPSLGVAPGASLTEPDPGRDTVSLVEWGNPFIEWSDANAQLHFTVQVSGIEIIRFTDFDDKIGGPDADCGGTPETELTLYSGAGADNVQCIAATIYAGSGADTVLGAGGADDVTLGAGADTAFVKKGGVDTVDAGRGADIVYASGNDRITSARVR